MRSILMLLIAILSLTSCSYNKQDLITAHNDSVTVIIDSLYQTDIPIPPLFNKEIVDSATVYKFFELAQATGGEMKVLIRSDRIVAEIKSIINSYAGDNADILFLIDKTGSMADDIQNVKDGLGQIIESIKNYHDIRVGVVLYGDKNTDGGTWYSFQNFETDLSASRKFINSIDVTNGGDYPESVYDGFFRTTGEIFWRSETKRMIILIGDAPPLEKPLSDYSIADVITAAKKDRIKMNFYPIVVTPIVGYQASSTTITEYKPAKLVSAIYPNPVYNNINLKLAETGKYSIELFSSAGNLLFKEEYVGKQWHKNLSSLSNGAYVVRVSSADGRFESSKFIIYK